MQKKQSIFFLEIKPRLNGAEVISEMEMSAGANARKNSHCFLQLNNDRNNNRPTFRFPK